MSNKHSHIDISILIPTTRVYIYASFLKQQTIEFYTSAGGTLQAKSYSDKMSHMHWELLSRAICIYGQFRVPIKY